VTVPEPQFSVVICTHNRASLLPRSIRSVLDQTFRNFEVVVVDDGSSDHTTEVVAEITDPRVRYVCRDNGGLSAARNTGVARICARALERRRQAAPGKLLSGTRYLLDQHRERPSRSPGLLADYCAVTGVAAARLGHYQEARRFLRMAARTQPRHWRHHLRLIGSLVPPLGDLVWKARSYNGAAQTEAVASRSRRVRMRPTDPLRDHRAACPQRGELPRCDARLAPRPGLPGVRADHLRQRLDRRDGRPLPGGRTANPRVVYHCHDANRGAAWNFSHLVNHASGPYFKWSGHDDLCDPCHIRRCVEEFRHAPPSVVLCYPQTILIDEAGDIIRRYDDGLDLRDPSPHEGVRKLLRNMGLTNAAFGLMRTDVLRRAGGVLARSGARSTSITPYARRRRSSRESARGRLPALSSPE
jgi:glycosyltransferase involved in cell wall biosynthesis